MENFKEKKVLYAGFLVFLILLFGPSLADAASLYLSPSSASYNVGQSFSVGIYVSSTDQTMNAASGAVSFPQDKLEVVSLSKSGSIFTLWVQEPTFSNSAGTIAFEGIVLNPGFIGSNGKTLTTNFKVKTAGTATLSFTSGSVLANDGKGTNILKSLGNATFGLGGTYPPTVSEPIIPGAPQAPQISSLTHPEPEKWYSNNDPEFNWKLPPGVTGVSLLLHESPTANPGSTSDGLIESKKFENVEDGTWYFHIKFRNQYGWGGVTHREVLIDTEAPEPFKIKADNNGDPTNPSPILYFSTTDSLSGVEYYEFKIGEGNPIPITTAYLKTNPYKIPPQAPGKHTIIVKALDAASNEAIATTNIIIEPIEPPLFIDFPKTISTGDVLTIKGTSKYPDAIVTVFVKKEGEEESKKDVKTDNEGNWFFVYDRSLEKGVYQVWAEITDSRGAKSNPTEKITIAVTLPPLLKFGKIAIDYLTVIITLIILIVGAIVVIFYTWYRISLWRKRVEKETGEVEESVLKAFRFLREKVEEQLEYLDKNPGLTKGEKEIHDNLQKSLNISEEFIRKEIKDIEKELK